MSMWVSSSCAVCVSKVSVYEDIPSTTGKVVKSVLLLMSIQLKL